MEKTEFIKKFKGNDCDALEIYIKAKQDTVYYLLYVKVDHISRYFTETAVTNGQDGRTVHIDGEIADVLTDCPSILSFHRKWSNRVMEDLTTDEQSSLMNDIIDLLDLHKHIITIGLFQEMDDKYDELFNMGKN